MSPQPTPAISAFVAALADELSFAQVLIRRQNTRFELRHVEDGALETEKLRPVALEQLRPLAQLTAEGAFRPLKSAPNLQRGWRFAAADDAALESALNHLYPGAVADWFAVRRGPPAVTHYREFTGRQTGMYRVTQMLDDAQAAAMIRAGCHRNFCLKQRLWTVNGLDPDSASEKSLIPCLEPCAVLLEFARTTMRLEQNKSVPLELAPDEISALTGALESLLRHPEPAVREADFSSPSNPRRLQLLKDKLATPPPRGGGSSPTGA